MKIYLNEIYKEMPTEDAQFLYFLQIGSPKNRLYKIGTTSNIARRMKEHRRYYKEDITILWYKKVKSKYTTLRVEDNQKAEWIETEKDWECLRNDRFILPKSQASVKVRIRKIYEIPLDCNCYEVLE